VFGQQNFFTVESPDSFRAGVLIPIDEPVGEKNGLAMQN